MKIERREIRVQELCKNYKDDGDDGVYGYDGRLTIRPNFQRAFVYSDQKRALVIDTVRKGFPLGLVYWNKTGDDSYEVLDGQQRIISISQYVDGDYAVKIDGNDKFWHNLTDAEKAQILDYKLMICICEGDEDEKLAWFKRINVAGEVLTNQELLNATYAGPWLSDAKAHFSKRGCVACKFSEGFVKGNAIRQEYLEKAIRWVALRDGFGSNDSYMAIHQKDENANDLWEYFQKVVDWAKSLFPRIDKRLTDSQDWGLLYVKHKDKQYDVATLRKEIEELLADEEVTNQPGTIPYVLSDKTKNDEKFLSLRVFPEQMKRRVYEKQEHECPMCKNSGINTKYDFDAMQGDHIIPWSKGGKTVEDNLQMLCLKHNLEKGDA